jgi:hypothetical protein
MRDIIVLFGGLEPDKLSAADEQLEKVLTFRRGLEEKKELLFSTYDEPAAFENHLRRQLAGWLRQHRKAAADGA